MGGNGSHSSGSGTGRDFPPVFSWDWDGKRYIFVGMGWERFENSLPCHPLLLRGKTVAVGVTVIIFFLIALAISLHCFPTLREKKQS